MVASEVSATTGRVSYPLAGRTLSSSDGRAIGRPESFATGDALFLAPTPVTIVRQKYRPRNSPRYAEQKAIAELIMSFAERARVRGDELPSQGMCELAVGILQLTFDQGLRPYRAVRGADGTVRLWFEHQDGSCSEIVVYSEDELVLVLEQGEEADISEISTDETSIVDALCRISAIESEGSALAA